MKFTMTAPCPKCPFRTDIRPFLTPARGREIANALAADQTFQCHQTIDYAQADDDGDVDPLVAASAPNAQHCAGALIVLEKMNRPNQMMRICERLGMYDRRKLQMDAPVFPTLTAFARAQRVRTATTATTATRRRRRQKATNNGQTSSL